MRNYECKCLDCGGITQVRFETEPYPEYGQEFLFYCKSCNREAFFSRTLTRKTANDVYGKLEIQ